jgi:poly(beta-D-mannuronate) lyase
MFSLTKRLAAVAFVAAGFTAPAKQYPVTSAADIAALTNKLRAGDIVVMADGTWTNQAIAFYGRGTAKNPVTLRARTPGKVILNGESTLTVTGEHVVVSGLLLRDAQSNADGIQLGGDHCRLTDSAVIGGTHKFFVHIVGNENRMDHCYLAEKASGNPTLQIEVGSRPNHDQIDHNYFGHRPPLGRNGGETMRVGYSWQSMSNSAAIVEDNLFERCDGEIEIISNKSCENIYRRNTFLDCAGMLTLRHGNRCLVENNVIIAHHKRGSGGIRVIGEDHTVINNYIDGVEQGAFWITSGISNSPLRGYFQARNCVIASNTVVDSKGPYVDVSAGIGTSGRTLLPENITVANNLFSLPPAGRLLQGTESKTYKWVDNLSSEATTTNAHAGINPTRDAKPVTPRSLTAAEVGPSWLKGKS